MHAATIRGQLLFLSLSSRCGYYSRAATIRGAASIRINTVYITDTLNNRIQVLDHEGKFIRSIKKTDKQRQYPHNPQKIKIFKGYIYTTEYHMNSVCVFTLAGNFVTTFGQGHITHPEGIAINEDGYVYVSSNKETIVVF